MCTYVFTFSSCATGFQFTLNTVELLSDCCSNIIFYLLSTANTTPQITTDVVQLLKGNCSHSNLIVPPLCLPSLLVPCLPSPAAILSYSTLTVGAVVGWHWTVSVQTALLCSTSALPRPCSASSEECSW